MDNEIMDTLSHGRREWGHCGIMGNDSTWTSSQGQKNKTKQTSTACHSYHDSTLYNNNCTTNVNI